MIIGRLTQISINDIDIDLLKPFLPLNIYILNEAFSKTSVSAVPVVPVVPAASIIINDEIDCNMIKQGESWTMYEERMNKCAKVLGDLCGDYGADFNISKDYYNEPWKFKENATKKKQDLNDNIYASQKYEK
jgi:hypothetical protein